MPIANRLDHPNWSPLRANMEPALQALIASLVSFLFVSLIFALLVLICRDGSKSRLSDVEGELALRSLGRTRSLPLPYAAEESSASYDPSLNDIAMSELVAATRDFAADGIIGDGSFGFVYKARLSSGVTVAVKRLSKDAAHGVREFKAEMDTLGRIRHPNLVRMLGFCVAGRDRVLVYEYVKHGSLDQWLHEEDDEGRPRPLPWRTRLGIVRGVAAGLAFLHDSCRPAVIHRDIKASNVLLDEGFEARITDFGLARLVEAPRTHVSTQVAGTMGYMAPEYWEGATVATVKGDVYSFGILMLEVATGRRPNLGVRQEGGGGRNKEMLLAKWARAMVEQGRIPEILDSQMGSEDVVESEVAAYLKVAFRCTDECSRKRPAMGEVLADLNQL